MILNEIVPNLNVINSSAFNGPMNTMSGFNSMSHPGNPHHTVAAMTPVTPIATSATMPMTHAAVPAGSSCIIGQQRDPSAAVGGYSCMSRSTATGYDHPALSPYSRHANMGSVGLTHNAMTSGASAMASATHSYHQSMNGTIQYGSHNSHNSTGNLHMLTCLLLDSTYLFHSFLQV